MNRGAQLLADKLEKRGDQAGVARSLGVGAGVVSHWVAGGRTPDVKYRALLEDQYGIPWRSWDEPAEPETQGAA